MTASPIVAARGVTRRFGGLVALDGIDIGVPAGIVQAMTFVGVTAWTMVALLREPHRDSEFEGRASMRSLSWPADHAS